MEPIPIFTHLVCMWESTLLCVYILTLTRLRVVRIGGGTNQTDIFQKSRSWEVDRQNRNGCTWIEIQSAPAEMAKFPSVYYGQLYIGDCDKHEHYSY